MIPVIISGGVGARLWPVSRELHPKPFIRLGDGQSLLQKTFLRAAQLPMTHEVVTVTNRELLFKTQDDYRDINHAEIPTSYILEPFGRGTAAAIAAAALHIEKTHGAEALMLVLPADHLITNQKAFLLATRQAEMLAKNGKLVLFGLPPDAPETGYGYVEADGSDVVRFVEKPSLAEAKTYCDSGRFLWNAGMFCFTAGALLAEMKAFCPDILRGVRNAYVRGRSLEGAGLAHLELDAESFREVPEDSIDYAVMEKSRAAAVVRCVDMGWSDVGSWNALAALVKPSGQGRIFLHNVSNCHIESHDRVVGAVGVDNLIIIDTPDALLVADKQSAQEVKHLYAQLKTEGHETHKHHRTMRRAWGSYTVLEQGEGFKIKRIEVTPGASLSLQMHHRRSEHWVVISGVAHATVGSREITVHANESCFIPIGCTHRLHNPGPEALIIIEVQTGHYLGEDDIVRLDAPAREKLAEGVN